MVSVRTGENKNDNQIDSFPLSDLQQAYLFGAQPAFDLHVATHTYFEFRLQNVDIAALETALNRLIVEHEVLRMTLTSDGQMRILERVEHYPITIADLTQDNAATCQQHLTRVRSAFERADMDFYRWPCFTVQVSRMPEQADHVHFNWSPMFIDGRSVSRLFHELSVLYVNPHVTCRQAVFSYANYAQQREYAKLSQAYAKATAYWWNRLPNLPYGPELPLAQGRQQPTRSSLVRRRIIIDADVWDALKMRVAESRLGLTALMLTLFAASVAQWSKSKHFTLTMLIQNRDRDVPGCDEAIASFASTVLVEMDFRQSQSLMEHVKAVQKRLFLDFAHAKVCGLEVLQQRNREQHSLARVHSLVAFVSNLEGLTDPEWFQDYFHRNGRHLVRSNLETPQIGLDHQIAETQSGELVLNWDAMDDMFYPGVVDDILNTYRGLIVDCALIAVPWAGLLRLTIPHAQVSTIDSANNTRHHYDKKYLSQLLQDQVLARRDAPALLSSSATLDYRQLQHEVVYWSEQLNDPRQSRGLISVSASKAPITPCAA